jgi:endogenous inhibitor of DNA gyrase (YacG/DUF329 family)
MIQGRCPICSKSYEIAAIDDLPAFPFCSDRCKLIDLGRWIDGSYVVPESAKEQQPDPAPAEATDEDAG